MGMVVICAFQTPKANVRHFTTNATNYGNQFACDKVEHGFAGFDTGQI